MPEDSGCDDQAMPTIKREGGGEGRILKTHSALDNAKLGEGYRVLHQ